MIACLNLKNMMGLAAVVHIATVLPDTQHMKAVQVLWREESRWLGYLPKGAFDQAAREGRIAAAFEDARLLGYVLYCLSQGRVMITHLTVKPAGRKCGVARALIKHLSESYPMTSGIGLRCRRDYPANSYWPKVGFVALHDKEGRSQEGMPLTFWWQDHGHPGLFSQTSLASRSRVVLAAIDANVFFDLVGEPRPQGHESLALRDDWIQDEVNLGVTDEILNDINRDLDDDRRKQQRKMRAGFTSISARRAEVDAKRALLRGLFPATLDVQTASDLEHISLTATAEVPYFITRDEGLLSLSADIVELVGVVVLSPTEFINRVDRLRREVSYRPMRLAGGVIKFGLLLSEEVDELARVFGGSSPTPVRKQLRGLLLQPESFSCLTAREQNGDLLAVIAHTKEQDPLVCDIVLFQVCAGAAAETVARYLLHRQILQAASQGRKLVRLGEGVQDLVVRRAALEEYGFIPEAGSTALVKYCRRTVGTASDLVADLESLMQTAHAYFGAFKGAVEALRLPAPVNSPTAAAALEETLWPAKIADANLPSFLVPIKARWAERLFDEDFASQMLIATGARRLMAREGVYYRAPNRAGLTAPARLLWYVSTDAAFPGSGAVRACSAIEDIEIGPATSVYGRFRRLGVYRWEDIAKITGGNENAPIMAVRFVNTEPFVCPVAWNRLAGYGVRGSVQGPTKITPDVFAKLYRTGMNL